MNAKQMLKVLRAWLVISFIGTICTISAFLLPDIISGKIHDYSSNPRHWFLGALFKFQTFFILLLPTVIAAVILCALHRRFPHIPMLTVLIGVAFSSVFLLASLNSKSFPSFHHPRELWAFLIFAGFGAVVLWRVGRPQNRVEQGSDGKPDTVVS